MSAERDEDAALLQDSRPAQDDPTAALLRARVRQKLLGGEVELPKIGRFTITAIRGAGAMGTVYEAHDPVLDRTIALKRLARGGRMLAEARALAKLTHPNVVSVFDAGEDHDGAVFIAMELVDGTTFDRWCSEAPRTADAILDVLTRAGDGIAAAHAAGIVHSDVKPSNILVGAERVCVADFSVARVADDDPTGGTPKYLSPERRAGAPPTAQSDQYAFAVTALDALTKKTIRPTAKRALERACHDDPDQRFPSVTALLDELQPPPAKRVAWWWPAAAVVLIVIAVVLLQRDRCAGGEALVRPLWNTDLRSAMTTAVERAGGPFDQRASARINQAFDRFGLAWSSLHRQTCEATRVTGVQSDSSHDDRMRCLVERLDAATALRDELLRGTRPSDFVRGVSAAAGLTPALRTCATRGAQPKTIPSTAQNLTHQSRAQYELGRYDDARRTAARALAAATDPGARAEAELLMGITVGRTGSATVAEASLERALGWAAVVKDDRRTADIWVWLLKSRLFSGAYDDVVTWASFARAGAVRADLDTVIVDGIVGEALLGRGDVLEAIAILEPASTHTDDTERRAIVLTNLGKARLMLGDADAADEHFVRALDLMVERLGDDHPGLGFYVEKLGRSRLARGDPTDALMWCERALAVRVAAYGKDDRAVATSALCAADALLELGRIEDARTRIETARQIRSRTYGPDHPGMIGVDRRRAALAMAEGNWSAAAEALERIRARAEHDTHPDVLETDVRLAQVWMKSGQRERATARLRDVRQRAERLPRTSPVWRLIESVDQD